MSLLNLPYNVNYHLYNGKVNMRCSFNGLTNLIRGELGRSPLSGDLFIFFNKRRDQVKLLMWNQHIYHNTQRDIVDKQPDFYDIILHG